MAIETIVVGVDDSVGSAAAIATTAELAAALGARVVAVHAFDALDHLGEVAPGHDFSAIRDEIAETMAQVWTAPLVAVDVAVEPRIEEGKPADVILDVVAEVGADLVVVGARRQGWVKALALGSTSLRVVHDAACPVTVVKAPPEAT